MTARALTRPLRQIANGWRREPTAKCTESETNDNKSECNCDRERDRDVAATAACGRQCEYKNACALQRSNKTVYGKTITSADCLQQQVAASCEDPQKPPYLLSPRTHKRCRQPQLPKLYKQLVEKIPCDKDEPKPMAEADSAATTATTSTAEMLASTTKTNKAEYAERHQNRFLTMLVSSCTDVVIAQQKQKPQQQHQAKTTAKSKKSGKEQIITSYNNLICEDHKNTKLVYFEYNEGSGPVEFLAETNRRGTPAEKTLNPTQKYYKNSEALLTHINKSIKAITLPQKYFLIAIFLLSLLATLPLVGKCQAEIASDHNPNLNNRLSATTTLVPYTLQSQPRTPQRFQLRNISKPYQTLAINSATSVVTVYASDADSGLTTPAAASNTHLFKTIKYNSNSSKISLEISDYGRNVPTSLILFNNIIYKHNPKTNAQLTSDHIDNQKSKSDSQQNKSPIKFIQRPQQQQQQQHLRNIKKAKNKIKHGHDTEIPMNHNSINAHHGDNHHRSTLNDDIDSAIYAKHHSEDVEHIVQVPMDPQHYNRRAAAASVPDAGDIDIFAAADDKSADADENEYDDMYQQPNRFTNYIDNQKLMRLVMDGLGLQKLPDMQKVNISQLEYANKYREYLQRVHERKRREFTEEILHNRSQYWEFDAPHKPLGIVSISIQDAHLERRKRDMEASELTGNFSQRSSKPDSAQQRKEKTRIRLHFPLKAQALQLLPGDIEEANIRLMLIHSPSLAIKKNINHPRRHCGGGAGGAGRQSVDKSTGPQKHVLNLKVYQILNKDKRLWLDGRKIDIEIDRNAGDTSVSQWLQFDVTKAVESWLTERQSNLGLEIQCDNCQRVGARILSDASAGSSDEADISSVGDDGEDENLQLMPVLNIIGRLAAQHHETRGQSQREEHRSGSSREYHHRTNGGNGKQGSKNNCHKTNQRCCRHTMEVIFKEIKGFEFILHPKVFDAGYCHGRCPPRFNPAHHHAMLQSLIWKQSKSRAPRPCCAPSKLVPLEVLHVDEKDSSNLKISTWADMQVVKCACS